MALKIFTNVKYNELAQEVPKVKELNFDSTDVFLNFDNKSLVLNTNNGLVNVDFDTYDELLDVIIRLGRLMIFRDTLDTLNQVYYSLEYHTRDPRLMFAENLMKPLLDGVEEVKQKILKSNFKWMIKMGELAPKQIDLFIESDYKIKKAVDNATEKYRELCWETYEDDDPDYCDHAIPVVDIIYYAIPEEKSITVVVKVDQIGEVYRNTEIYNNAYDFLKALDEYSNKVIDFW